MKVNRNIFKEYDIRGTYPREINEKITYGIGRAFAEFLKPNPPIGESPIVVGRDKRSSSPKLASAFISGLADSGVKVVDIGKVTTPMFYFAVPFLKARAGAMITASHLFKNNNGVKFVRRNSEPVGGNDLQKIYELSTSYVKPQIDMRCRFKKINMEKDYFKAMGGLPRLGRAFPKVSFDFDQDRLILTGFRGDVIGGVVADITAKKGDVVVYDLTCTRAIPEYLRNKGIRAIPSRVGHYNIIKLMREKKAVFGLEMTGHYYFKNFHYCEAPVYALNKLLEQKKTLAELSKPFNKYFHSEIINIEDPQRVTRNVQLIERLKEKYRNGAQNDLDGLTVEFSNWWFNVRPSHTESVIRLAVEAKTKELLKEKKNEILSYFK